MQSLNQHMIEEGTIQYIQHQAHTKKAKINYFNGDTYIGEVHNILQKPNGVGILKTSKAQHTGLFRNGTFLCGTSTFENGVIYIGSWEKAKKSGEGTLKCANGDSYQGFFINNLYEGQGILKYKTGSLYEGVFKKGQREGKGVYQCIHDGNKGFRYQGQWKSDCFNGQGILQYSNGEIYKGSFISNKKEGHGFLIMSSGNTYEGQFINNLYHGYGKLSVVQSNIIYEGDFRCGIFHGEGRIQSPQGKLQGIFENGELSGQGKWFKSNGDIYIGSFLSNKPHGSGVYIHEQDGKQETRLSVTTQNGIIINSQVLKD